MPPSSLSPLRVVIVGGGVMGCSSAWWTARLARSLSRPIDITVLERNPSYTRASSALSVSSIRQQFSNKENIQMSLFSAGFIKDAKAWGLIGDDIQFWEGGYLFLATKEREGILKRNTALQRELGASINLMSPADIRRKFPWLKVDDISCGALGVKNEGWFDPWQLLFAFKKSAGDLGVKFVTGEVTGINHKNTCAESVVVTDSSSPSSSSASASSSATIPCDILINAAGPWAAPVTTLGATQPRNLAYLLTHPSASVSPVPVSPRRRCVFSFSCAPNVVNDCPLVVDPTGQYFRREANSSSKFLTGISPPADQDLDFWDDASRSIGSSNREQPPDVDHSLWQGLWEGLASRVPHFEGVKAEGSWAGYYEYNTEDQNGIIGRHPQMHNMLLACGFSGHGIQQSPAVGRAISELVIHGDYRTLQLQRFSFERFATGQLVVEENVV